jgi:hypothetical protein
MILFSENGILNGGLPSMCFFALSTKAESDFTGAETLAGATIGEITGTSYSRLSEAEPTAVGGTVTFSPKAWNTSTHSDWPASVKSVVLCSDAGTSGVAIAAFNLQAAGAGRDMSTPNTGESVDVSLSLTA